MNSKIEKIKIRFGNKEVSARKLTVSSEIPLNIESGWEKITKSATLEFVAAGVIKFHPLDGQFPEIWKEGEIVKTKMTAYGFIPLLDVHSLSFEKIDEENKIIETKEKDNVAKVWDHKMSLKPISDNSFYYEDEVILYGGMMTGVLTWWAKTFYEHRHKRWQLLVKE